jgi:integrase
VGATIKYMKKMGYLVSDIDMPKIRLPKGRLRYLSFEEETQFLKAINPYREVKGLPPFEDRHPELKRQMIDFYDMVILLLDTGARHGEICTLEWDKVNLDQKSIALWRPKVRNESVIYMADRVLEILKRRYATKSGSFIFQNKVGSARNHITHTFQKAFKRAGISGCTAHTLRHTHATRLIQNGLNLYEIKEILGHADIKTTMRYAHIEQQSVSRKATDLINLINQNSNTSN